MRLRARPRGRGGGLCAANARALPGRRASSVGCWRAAPVPLMAVHNHRRNTSGPHLHKKGAWIRIRIRIWIRIGDIRCGTGRLMSRTACVCCVLCSVRRSNKQQAAAAAPSSRPAPAAARWPRLEVTRKRAANADALRLLLLSIPRRTLSSSGRCTLQGARSQQRKRRMLRRYEKVDGMLLSPRARLDAERRTAYTSDALGRGKHAHCTRDTPG